MKHLKSVNRKASRIEAATNPESRIPNPEGDVVALQRTGLPQNPHFPLGCSLVFSPGW